MENERKHYEERARQQLDLAEGCTDEGEKIRHLDKAAAFATLGERSAAPHRVEPKPLK